MKLRWMIVIAGILLSAAAVRAADLELSESTISYGTIKEGPPVIKNITVTNRGSRTLTIASAKAS